MMTTESTESAVEFPTPTRIHVALAVRDVPQAVDFYRALLGQEPTKVRPGYAKFEVIDPPLNLSLNETPEATAPPLPQHYGIQVKRRAAIREIAARLAGRGFAGEVEDQVTCCYAVQDKVWVSDPDGHRWELFIVTEADTAVHSKGRPTAGPTATGLAAPCCGPAANEASNDPTTAAEAATEAVSAEPQPACCAPTCCT